MSIELQTEQEHILIVRVSGKLTREDYALFIPKVDQILQQQHQVSILFDMQDFHGWEATAAWEDAKFAFRHFSDIDRVALVGDKKWQKAMAIVCKPFTRAEVRSFPRAKRAEAEQWLQEQPAAH